MVLLVRLSSGQYAGIKIPTGISIHLTKESSLSDSDFSSCLLGDLLGIKLMFHISRYQIDFIANTEKALDNFLHRWLHM